MKSIKRNLAVLLAVLLVIPTLTAAAQTDPASTGGQKTVETSVEEAAPPKGGSTEGGSTEGVSTESGSTESGSTEGGSTESGSTEDGSTESGSTEGGSTEDGSTEGGSTESGSMEGGSTEGGSTESGSTEGGSTESGSTEDGLTGEDPDLAESKEKETEEAETEEESKTKETRTEPSEEVLFNTGSCVFSVVGKEDFLDYELGDAYFEDDGSYTINIPEENPFFPYEVQFTYDGSTTNRWFMTPDDSVEVGGHRFYVSAYFDGTAVTQLSLRVGGDKVTVYPEKKEFTDGDGISEASLQPLEERRLTADLSEYTPAELTMVSTDAVLGNAVASGDKVAWTYRGEGDYTVSGSGDRLDLSYNTYSGGRTTWEMIVGEGDQLAVSDIRYLVTLTITASGEWLIPIVYWQDRNDPQNRIEASVTRNQYYDYNTDERRWEINIPNWTVETWESHDSYIAFEIDSSFWQNSHIDHFRVYEGQHRDVASAEAGNDITSLICCDDMSQPNAGYHDTNWHWITIVTYDASGQATGCLPFELRLSSAFSYVSAGELFKRENGIRTYVVDSKTGGIAAYFREEENTHGYALNLLYQEYAADDTYYLTMSYYWGGNRQSSAVTAAYVGSYKSMAEAASYGASDIKDALFGEDYNTQGYAADYSGGVPFTIFVGEDSSTEQEIYYYTVKAVTGTNSADRPSSSTDLQFLGLKDGSKADVPCYIARMEDDSYAERNYITILVDAGTDLTRLAPVYAISDGAKLYAPGSSTPEKSGESFHDFSKEPIHYTVRSEDRANERSYWLKVVPGVNGKGQLYINSLEDERSDTKIVDGVIYSTREMMLDAYHDYVHDIWMANMGTDPIPALSVTLESNTVELDEYWTLSGNHDLSGFSATDQATDDRKMSNLAKVRIRAKDGVDAGTEITGTLTVKSKDTTLMVLNLTGTVGNPRITTDNIPQAVKYVPYGTMIQNNNKYSWNKVSYSLTSGSLPAGMTVENGEIYGVPTETGSFTFTVRMDNSFYSFGSDTKTYTLEVIENTDANVDGATDQGYDLTQRVQNVDLGQLGGQELSEGDRTLVSNGEFAEFVAIYLDGNKLEKGTDYTAEAGSTRITIRSQTLANTSMARGTHTLGIEFRVKDTDTDTLKRAAQNYTIKGQDTEGGNNQGGSGNGQGGSGDDNGSGGSDGGGSGDGNVSGGGGSPAGKSTVEKGNGGNAETGEGNSETIENPPEEDGMEYIVQAGDSLWKIAEQFYGSGMYWQKIYERNTAIIRDPDKLQIGWKLLIPSAQPEEEGMAEVNGTYYTVEAGDTLWSISKKFYGVGWRWRRIYHANDSISEPGSIYEGQVIVIPK